MSYSSSSASFSSSCSIATTASSVNNVVSTSSSANRTSRRWFPVSCNKCREPIDSTAFVCSCECLFCEDCTYSHFQSSPNCPGCGRILGENDFTEVTVSDPDSKLANNPDEILQSFLTKTSNQPGAPITWNDVCAAVLREQDALLANTKFFVNQFVKETHRALEEGRNSKNQIQAYRKQIVVFKEDVIGLKRRHEEDTERMRQKDRQLAEKDRQIQQLKNMLARTTNGNNTENGGMGWPSGSRSVPASIGVPGSSSSSPSSAAGLHRSRSGFQNYVRKKEERELAQEQDLMNLTRKNNPIMYRRQR